MEKKLYFFNFSKDVNQVIPCEFLEEKGDLYYFRDVNKTLMSGIVVVNKKDFDKINWPADKIISSPATLEMFAEYGSEDQKKVMIAIPKNRVIVPGSVEKDENGYCVKFVAFEQAYRLDMKEFGKTFSAFPFGTPILPWIYVLDDPMKDGTPCEYPFLCNARTEGISCFLNRPDFQFVLKIPPNDVLSILKHAAALTVQGYEFKGNQIVPFYYKNRPLKTMWAKTSSEDDTPILRLLLADKNGLFPGDDGVELEYEAQNVDTDFII